MLVLAIRCPEPPADISRGRKFGKVYETDSHVNYVCETGFSVRGNSIFFQKPFIAVVCGPDGKWNANLTEIRCESERLVQQTVNYVFFCVSWIKTLQNWGNSKCAFSHMAILSSPAECR